MPVRSADKEHKEMLASVIAKYHPSLVEYKVRVGIIVAFARRDELDRPKGPAVKLHGYPCWATVKINSQKDRVEGKPDATVTIDGDRWDDLPEARQIAILDHECHHLVPTGETDDCFRPKLEMRLHDIVIGGFSTIAERHGADSVEVETAEQIATAFGQLLFSFMREPAVA